MASNGAVSTKDYKINVLEIVSSSGQTIDVRNIFEELQIYQDIYSSVMSGQLIINDGADIFCNFALCGNDYLRVSIDKPSLGIPLEKIFRIYKVADRKPVKNSSQIYNIHFCSDEMVLSNSMRVSKSYKGYTVADIIYDVLLNVMKVDPSRIDMFEGTAGTYDFIVPYYRPFEVIQWATARAYNTQPKFCYFFYESMTGFNFKSLQSLYEQEPYKKISYDIKKVDAEIATNKDSIDKFKILNDFDYMTSVSNGSVSSRLLAVDIFSQSYKNYDYSLDLAESGGNLLNDFKQFNEVKTVTDKTNFTSYESYFTTYIQINDTGSERENSIDKWMQPRALHLAALNSFRFMAVLPGDIVMRAGDVVEFDFPKMVAPDESGKQMDPYRTGKYLVTALNHKFDKTGFESIVEFSSDSYSQAIPAATDLTSIIKKKI
jgi:hypothetical protein